MEFIAKVASPFNRRRAVEKHDTEDGQTDATRLEDVANVAIDNLPEEGSTKPGVESSEKITENYYKEKSAVNRP